MLKLAGKYYGCLADLFDGIPEWCQLPPQVLKRMDGKDALKKNMEQRRQHGATDAALNSAILQNMVGSINTACACRAGFPRSGYSVEAPVRARTHTHTHTHQIRSLDCIETQRIVQSPGDANTGIGIV